MAFAGFPRDVPVCIDGRMLGEGGTGVSTYARALMDAATRISARPCLLRSIPRNVVQRGWRSLWPGERLAVAPALDDGPINLTGGDVFRTAHMHFGLRRQLYRLRSELKGGIMHWSYPVPIVLEGWTNIYTVHDVIPLDRPELSPIDPQRHRTTLSAIVERCDRIVTVSADARASIIRQLGCKPDLVVNAGQAVDPSNEAISDPQAGLVAMPYLLWVGSIEPRKNLAAILAAYRWSALTIPLVIVGPDGWNARHLLAEIAATPGAFRLPYQSRAAMLGLLRGARALVFLSLAEGFGLPVIEAMALGTPVLTSDRGALAETAGDAALKVDPTDIAAIARGLRRIAMDDGLAASLRVLGKARSETFTMSRMVDRLSAIYHETLLDRAEAAKPSER